MFFIYCADKETRDALLRLGFHWLNQAGEIPYVFLNEPTFDWESYQGLKARLVFSNEMIYSNVPIT